MIQKYFLLAIGVDTIQQSQIVMIGAMNRSKSETVRHNEDITALISHEYELVREGKEADKLAELFHEYEMSPFTQDISKNPVLLKKYGLALLINNNYNDLFFMLKRNSQEAELAALSEVAAAGNEDLLEVLWKNTQSYCQTYHKEDQLIVQRIMESTLNHYLRTLAKHFITFEMKELQKWTSASQKQVEECGVKIEKGLIHLKQQEIITPCLQSKLKELVLVTSKMSQLE